MVGEIGKEKKGIKGEENPVLSHIKVIIIQMLKVSFKDIIMGNQRRKVRENKWPNLSLPLCLL